MTMKSSSYMQRAMRSSDPRFARALSRMGYTVPKPRDPLAPLRTEAEALGVKVDGRWGEERLKAEIEAAKAPKPVQRKPKSESDTSEDKAKRFYQRRDMQAAED